MQELDEWTEKHVITPMMDPPIIEGVDYAKMVPHTIAAIKQDIRDKVLESYHNGQAAGPRKEVKARRYAAR
jgi:hypothetical protein